tara:strand:- start:156 stop:347 length:192 start_codon:yes stop_codon:yes gene_type:complete
MKSKGQPKLSDSMFTHPAIVVGNGMEFIVEEWSGVEWSCAVVEKKSVDMRQIQQIIRSSFKLD